jgi:hypothetical protein
MVDTGSECPGPPKTQPFSARHVLTGLPAREPKSIDLVDQLSINDRTVREIDGTNSPFPVIAETQVGGANNHVELAAHYPDHWGAARIVETPG